MSIDINNTFLVAAPIDQAWAVLNDIARVSACVPGAELTDTAGDNIYKGRIAVRLGPVQLQFGGSVEFLERDAAAHRARIRATGNELKGRGSARALMTCNLRPEGTDTRVDIATALDLAGQVAQYGRGAAMITSVAQQLVNDFADALAADMRAAGGPTTQTRKTEIDLASLLTRAWWRELCRWFTAVFTRK